jgi:thiol-disulfide isomerase/thioredoxin
MLNVMLRKLQEEYDNKFEYHEIIAMSDRKEHPLAKQYGIYSVPTLIVFKDGKIILQEVYPEYERIKNLIEVEINGKGNDEERKEDVSACKA